MNDPFAGITLHPKYHSYSLNGKRLTSVTKICSQFKEPFDREGRSLAQALKRGVSQAVVLAEWDAKAEESRRRGTQLHQHVEQVLLSGISQAQIDDPFLSTNKLLPEAVVFERYWQEQLSAIVDPYRVEWVVGDAQLGIGGKIDTVFKVIEKDEYNIFDWKTGSFSTGNPWRRFLLPPFSDLGDSDHHYYSIQSSLYRLILERNTELPIGKSYIIHLSQDGYQVYEALDLRDRLRDWFVSQRNGLKR